MIVNAPPGITVVSPEEKRRGEEEKAEEERKYGDGYCERRHCLLPLP